MSSTSWNAGKQWLPCIKPQCKLIAEPGPRPRSPAHLQLELLFKWMFLHQKMTSSCWKPVSQRNATSRTCSINLSPLTPAPETQFQAWKMQGLARLGEYRTWSPPPFSLQIPGAWALKKPCTTERGPLYDSCKQVVSENVEMARIFPSWNQPNSLCISVSGTFMIKI